MSAETMTNKALLFGAAPDGSQIHSVTLNAHGLTAKVMTYGASLMDLRLEGIDHSLVLGFSNIEDYLVQKMYWGANVGRFANRIAGAKFELDGRIHELDKNFLGKHILHGGADGSGTRNWTLVSANENSAIFEDILPDGHMGFPGKLSVRLVYTIKENATLNLEFTATTDAPTVCNFAHHSYFNLSGERDISNHILHVDADHHLGVDEDLIPTGEQAPVANGYFDFKQPKALGGPISQTLLDHNFCLSNGQTSLRDVAKLLAPKSGVEMVIATTEPGLQVYDGSGLGDFKDHSGNKPFSKHAGLAMEPQGWPDAPNHESFPSSVLRPGETYIQQSEFRFSYTK